MSFVVPNQPRRPGSEWARQQLFGSDTSTNSSAADFRQRIIRVADLAISKLTAAEADARDAATRNQLEMIVSDLDGVAHALVAVREQLSQRDVDRPFRVVLMGRTMAGKSTLFEYLSQGTGSRIGVGAQRTTRDTSVHEIVSLRGVEVVDTPGVGAMDGQEDYDTAFAQVPDADLILWVATDQATQEQTGLALQRLSDLGKPILVVLNCLADVQDEINYFDLLEEPERIFGGDAEDNLGPIRRHLSSSGGRYLEALPVHAQAAQLAASGSCLPGDAAKLLERSRIEHVTEAIRRQRDETSHARRYISITDSAKHPLLDVTSAVEGTCANLELRLASEIGSREVFVKRARRRIDDADHELRAAFAAAVTTRERWIDRIDVGLPAKEINKAWNVEVQDLKAELESSTEDVGTRLEVDLRGLAMDVAEDWSTFDTEGFRKLGGIGGVWGNRAFKVGGRVAGGFAGAAAGGKAGAFVGSLLVPGIGTAIGGAIGCIVGGAAGGLVSAVGSDWLADHVLQSSSRFRQRRRQRIHEQLAPILADLSTKADSWRVKFHQSWVALIEDEAERLRTAESEIRKVLDIYAQLSDAALEPAVTSIDTELARELLRLNNRDRAAESLVRATRWRGAGCALDLPADSFTEMLLFPVPDTVESMVPTVTGKSPSMAALQIIRTLTDQEICVREMTSEELHVNLSSPVSPGVREAWEAITRVHTGAAVHIEQTPKGNGL